MGKSQRDKGARNERNLVEAMRLLGYESFRVPLSGAVANYEGDVIVKIDGKELVAEVKSRKCEFQALYAHINICSGLSAMILESDPLTSKLCVVGYDLKSVLDYNGAYVRHPMLPAFNKAARKALKWFKTLKKSDFLAVKDDRKPFLYLRYL